MNALAPRLLLLVSSGVFVIASQPSGDNSVIRSGMVAMFRTPRRSGSGRTARRTRSLSDDVPHRITGSPDEGPSLPHPLRLGRQKRQGEATVAVEGAVVGSRPWRIVGWNTQSIRRWSISLR